MNLMKFKSFVIVNYTSTVIAAICKCLIISQVFYEYTGKYKGYVDNILLAYIICFSLLILLIVVGLYGIIFTDYDRASDDTFKGQMNSLFSITEKSAMAQTWQYTHLVLMILTAVSCVLLSKWVFAILFFVGLIAELTMIAIAHNFMIKHKGRVERLRSKVVGKEINKSKKMEEKAENPIVQRLNSIG